MTADGDICRVDSAWPAACDEDDCMVCGPYEEHTDRQARYLEQDADSAAINAAMEGLE